MKILKFRSWLKADKRMLYVPEDGKNINRVVMSAWRDREGPNSVFMQYVDLEDKNGKEIYEGDIIKTQPNPKEFNPVRIVEVRFSSSGVQYFLDNKLCAYGYTPEDEVIGNIFENPELLK